MDSIEALLRSIPTCKLVDELIKRDGVTFVTVESPDTKIYLSAEAPATILTVID